MNMILENSLIERLTEHFVRSPLQRNGLQESDAELISLPGSDTLLAVTTDSIVEEIELGLYCDPYLMGWMAATVNASDLAAVGAEPLGLLLSETFPHDTSEDSLQEVQRGVHDACMAAGLYILGGDTNFSSHWELGGSALGVIPDGLPMTRLGCKPGDELFVTGVLGLGSVHALVQLSPDPAVKQFHSPYQPRARVSEGQLLRGRPSCCMDTSDGALATLDQLMRLNQVGFVLESNADQWLHSAALQLSEAMGIPAWMMLAGLHGEFELLFAVPPERVEALITETSAKGWQPLKIGVVVETPGVWFEANGETVTLDTGRIRNLFSQPDIDIQVCIEQLEGLASYE